MKNYILTEKGKILFINSRKIIVEEGYVYLMDFSTTKMSKEKIIAESDDPEELKLKANKVN